VKRALLTVAFWMWTVPAVAASSGGAAGTAALDDAGAPEAGAAAAEAEASKQALAEGVAALAQTPPLRSLARSAFERAAAGGEPPTASQAHFRLGVLDEEDAEPARALEQFHASVDAAPGSRWARTARGRIAWMDERSEGDLAPLAALQRVRLLPPALRDPAAVDALAVEAESFPPGRVRSEARMLVAETWLKVAPRRGDALGELRKVVADPSSGAADAVLAERDLVEALLADNRVDEAAEETRARPFDPRAAAEVQTRLRRRSLRRAAGAELLVAFTLAVMVGVRAWRRRTTRSLVPGARVRRLPRLAVALALLLAGLTLAAAAFVLADAAGSTALQRWGL
jgi:hypothetical protein